MNQWIITATGPDRPGLVDELTGFLHQAGANILDSRMVNLRGQFAMVVLVEAPESMPAARDLPALAEKIGLRATVTPQSRATQPTGGVPYRLKTYSTDQPGIVHRITHLLREHGVNIEDLVTRQESAPFAGTPLFLMEARVTVPASVSVRKLRGDLTSLCDSLNCDVDLEPA